MGQLKDAYISVRREPWFYSVLLLTAAPLFSDYVSFPLIFASLFLALRDAKKNGRTPAFGKLGLLMAVYLLYMAFSLVYSTDFVGSFWSLMMWVSVFCAYVAAVTVLTDRQRLRTAVLCMTTVTGIVGGVAVLQYLLREVFHLQINGKLWFAADNFFYRLLNIPYSNENFGERMSGTFSNPNLLAAYLVLSIPFSIAFVLTGTRSKPKAAARISLIIAAYGLGFTFSRGGYLAIIAVGLLLCALFIRKRFVMTVLTVIYVVLLIPPCIGNRLLSAVPHNTQQSASAVTERENERPESLSQAVDQIEKNMSEGYADDYSVHMRFVMWKKVLLNVREHPLLGAGVGVQTTQDILSSYGLPFKHAHNLFLEILSEGGILSLFLFCCILRLLLRRGAALLKTPQHREAQLFGFAIIGALLALCVHGVFDFPLLIPRLLCTCMLLMGMTEAAARLYLHEPTRVLSFRRRRSYSPLTEPVFVERHRY